jgi:hypothetical protein
MVMSAILAMINMIDMGGQKVIVLLEVAPGRRIHGKLRYAEYLLRCLLRHSPVQ